MSSHFICTSRVEHDQMRTKDGDGRFSLVCFSLSNNPSYFNEDPTTEILLTVRCQKDTVVHANSKSFSTVAYMRFERALENDSQPAGCASMQKHSAFLSSSFLLLSTDVSTSLRDRVQIQVTETRHTLECMVASRCFSWGKTTVKPLLNRYCLGSERSCHTLSSGITRNCQCRKCFAGLGLDSSITKLICQQASQQTLL